LKSLAIIPARGGSKRIPGKNIKEFFGKPIIAYAIEAALESELFSEVMVSTDLEKIAKISKECGAKIPFTRSAKNSDDYAGTPEVLIEVIEDYSRIGKNFITACCINPTAPFTSAKKLQESYGLFQKENYDTVFPVVQYDSPIQRALLVDQRHKMSMFYPENLNKRSQELVASYHDAGQFYWFRPKNLMDTKQLWTDNSGTVIYPSLEAQDIDTLEDWHMAELKYSLLKSMKD